jgi:SecD/SecF fusion protein
MFVFGTGAIKTFSFTMMIGIFSGSFSSLFIAAPLAYLMMRAFPQHHESVKKK